MDIRGAFNHFSRNSLLNTMKGMGADNDLIKMMQSFMSDRSISLVIDGHQFTNLMIDTGSHRVHWYHPFYLQST